MLKFLPAGETSFAETPSSYDGHKVDDKVKYTSTNDETKSVNYHHEIMKPEFKAKIRRRGRKWRAERFRHDYIYGPNHDAKTCIWLGDDDTCKRQWPDKSSGIIWVGVLGKNSACVVTRAGHLDVRRAKRSYKYKTKEMVLRHFMEAAISEMEDLERVLPPELLGMFKKGIPRPFALVSVPMFHEASVSGIPCIDDDTKCGAEVSGDEFDIALGLDNSIWKQILEDVNSGRPPREYDATKLIGFIQEKMKSDPNCFADETLEASGVEPGQITAFEYLKMVMRDSAAFTVGETIQVAMTAFQHLFQRKFKANEIEVSVVDPNYRITWKEAERTGKHCSLWELETSEIEKYLAPINAEPGSGGSSSLRSD